MTTIRFTFKTERHDMRAPASDGAFHGRGAEYGTTLAEAYKSMMSKFKTIVWPKVILFGDSITQVRRPSSFLRITT